MKILLISASLLLLFILAQVYRRKRAKNKALCVIDSNCTGCRRCLKRCRRKVLDMLEGETGSHVVVRYPEKCSACGDCVAVCKFKALEFVNRE